MTKGLKQMMMTIRKHLQLCILVLFCTALGLQKVTAQITDARLWLSSDIEKNVSKKIDAGLEFEYRRDMLMSTFDKCFIQPALVYSINDNFRIGASYRAILDQNKTREQNYEQRYSANVRYKFEIDDFEIKLKTSLQYGFDEISNASFSSDQKLVNRYSIDFDYNWFGTKLTPFGGIELFNHINHPNGSIINQWRFNAGASYELTDQLEIDVFYMFENEFNVAFPTDSHIFGCSLSYQLD